MSETPVIETKQEQHKRKPIKIPHIADKKVSTFGKR
jgi:hypothetical protein